VFDYHPGEVQATDLAYHSGKSKVKDGPSTLTVWKIRRTKFEAPTETMRILPPPAQEPERRITVKLG
jgi:hypothetical protein